MLVGLPHCLPHVTVRKCIFSKNMKNVHVFSLNLVTSFDYMYTFNIVHACKEAGTNQNYPLTITAKLS